MTSTKILVTLPSLLVGGADVRSVNAFYALKMMGYDTSGLSLSFDMGNYFISYIKSIRNILSQKINTFLTNYDRVIILVTYPQYLYHILDLKETVGSSISVLWYPGGNDFCCALHTEVCPRSPLRSSYGCAYDLAFFLAHCIPHMLSLKKIGIYNLLIWANLRHKVLSYLDGFLASRSIYIKGCKLIDYKRCYFVGFGINTDLFKPVDKEKTTKIIAGLTDKVLFGDLNCFIESVRDGNGKVIGYVGAAEPWWKNVETLILAFNRLMRENKLPFTLKRETWLLLACRSAVKLLPLVREMPDFLKKKVIIMDRVDYKKVPYIYNLIDVFVNPSYLDSLEFNTLEALSSGNIILASNRGSIDDLLKFFGINVLKFEPNSVSLSNLLEMTLLDIDNLKKMFLSVSQKARSSIGLEAFGLRLKNAIEHFFPSL